MNYNNATWNPVIRDTEIGGALGTRWGDTAVGSWNYTLQRVDIHGFGDGPRTNGDVLIQDSYIHDLFSRAGDHNDGVQITQGGNVTLQHNRIENPWGQTSAIMIGADQGNINGVNVIDNILAGGGYTLYGGGAPPAGNTVKNIVITGNRFSTKFFAQSGQYGPTGYVDLSFTTWANNAWADGARAGQAINP